MVEEYVSGEQWYKTIEQLSEMEISNLLKKEFRAMIVRWFKISGKDGGTVGGDTRNVNKDLEELKNKRAEVKNTVIKMKNTLENINGRVTKEEEQITDLKNRMMDVNTMGKSLKKGERKTI